MTQIAQRCTIGNKMTKLIRINVHISGLVHIILLALYNVVFENWSPDRSFNPRPFTYNAAVTPP